MVWIRSMRAALAAAWLLALAVAAHPALAAEEILLFDSRVEVRPTGDFDVTETIRVRAEGNQIRRGIFRDFPTVRRHPSGLVEKFGFELQSVTRDGKPEPHHTTSIEGGVRIYAGAEDVFIAPGVHTYQLRYRTTRQIRRFADYDEVYWNATGNFWSFPIREAVATIVLPPGARILQADFYTGAFGAQGKDARIAARDERQIVFRTTRPLNVHEGLTVAVAFPKGVVPQPGPHAATLRAVSDNVGLLLLLIAPLPLGLYYWRTWRRVGLDPQKGIVIPLFEPPTGISPAAASYIYYRGTGVKMRGASRALVAALMSLAVKGVIGLVEDGRKLVIERRDRNSPVRDALPPGERAIESGLLGGRDRIVIDKSNATAIQSAVQGFERAMSTEYGGRFFRTNLAWTVLGLALSALALGLAAVLFPATETMVVSTLIAAGASFVGSTLLVQGVRRVAGDVPGGSAAFGVLQALTGAAVLVAAFAALVLLPGLAPQWSEWIGGNWATSAVAAAAMLLVLLNVAFAALLFAPTPEGRRIGDQLEGFRLYLSVAESQRLNLPGRPDFTTTLWERYLPYAVALGV
ncbi:MAG TPA: DUF2207 domain-containing protein, partial [Burkholderiaceae bacterium]|nr:DUF2207 domain-containing protein [Burkholderiaceae bacterium]